VSTPKANRDRASSNAEESKQRIYVMQTLFLKSILVALTHVQRKSAKQHLQVRSRLPQRNCIV
jgi:hypothetical protein